MEALPLQTPLLMEYRLIPPLPSPSVQSREELLAERMANQMISLSAKIILMILDPKQRPPMPKRESIIDFLECMNAEADRNIQAVEKNLKYFNR